MAGIGLHQTLSLGQTLSPQMQQSLQFLQAPALELQSLVQQEIEINPVLEEAAEEPKPETESEGASETENEEWDKQIAELRRFNVETSKIVRGKGRVGIYFVEPGANQRPSKVVYDREYSAIALAKPLGQFFHFPRSSLMLAVLVCGMVGWWSGFGLSLCQGMAWFKRLALIGVAGVGLRMLFAWLVTKPFPTAEFALSSTTVALMANFALFYWWKDIFRHPAQRISPWNREFIQFLMVTGATVGGMYFFGTGDSLVSNKYFT